MAFRCAKIVISKREQHRNDYEQYYRNEYESLPIRLLSQNGRVVHCVPSKTISFEFRSECQNSIFFFSFFLWIMKWNFESEENLMRHEIAFWRKKWRFQKWKDCKTVSPPSCKMFAWQKKIPRRVLASVCSVRCRSFKWNILSLQLTGFRIWRVLWWSWYDKIMLPCTYIWNIFGSIDVRSEWERLTSCGQDQRSKISCTSKEVILS